MLPEFKHRKLGPPGHPSRKIKTGNASSATITLHPAARFSGGAPIVLRSGRLTAPQAIMAVDAELAGDYPGEIVLGRRTPDGAPLKKAVGHRQVMDVWLVQIACEHRCMLATKNAGLVAAWPDVVERVA